MKLCAMMLSLLTLASVACSARAEDATDYPSKKIKTPPTSGTPTAAPPTRLHAISTYYRMLANAQDSEL